MNSKHFFAILLMLVFVMGYFGVVAPHVFALTYDPITSSPSCIDYTGAVPPIFLCFAKGLDNAIWEYHAGTWTSLGGVWESAPAVTSFGGTDLELVAEGLDNTLWWTQYNGASWSTWTNTVTGTMTLYPDSDPSCVSWLLDHIQCYVRGTDNDLWSISALGPSPLTWLLWFRPTPGGVLTSGPSASSYQSDEEDVFVRGIDGHLWSIHYDGTTWSSWSSNFSPALTLSSAYNPGCTSWGPPVARIDCFATGADNLLHHIYTTNGGVTWFTWSTVGGGFLTSGPSAVGVFGERLAVFARDYDFGLWVTNDLSGWSTWGPINSPAGVAFSVDAVYNSPFQGTLGFELTPNVFDNSGGWALVDSKTFGQSEVFICGFTGTAISPCDATRVNTATGELTFSDYSNAVVVAGPLANPTTAYYEANGIAPLRGQFDFTTHTATFFCCGAGGSLVYTVDMSSLTPTNDYFIMESFTDGGHIVVVLYGINAPGTLASGVHFKTVLSTLINYPDDAYIIHWQGSTPNVPLPTDTYTPVYSGSIPV